MQEVYNVVHWSRDLVRTAKAHLSSSVVRDPSLPPSKFTRRVYHKDEFLQVDRNCINDTNSVGNKRLHLALLSCVVHRRQLFIEVQVLTMRCMCSTDDERCL